MPTEVDAVRLFVSGLRRAVAFYRDVLGLPTEVEDRDAGYAIFRPGPRLILEELDDEHPDAARLVGRFAGLSLRVDDLGAACEELIRRGVLFVPGPSRPTPGETLAHFRDPDRNVLTLVQASAAPARPAERAAPGS